ncbi:similar to Saccharomyces cerevisiae YOL123W HRP1 Subunit of cleavage factor I, a five-subunit complex required for the cleavage and polyadenylation of pre-mRNA 3' ends [Maudiozyma barnettii]|uniref:Similar to Saccharomyces cerevisiae YOL123W HRP1 Subunit of cleavage factor I, a five-subunit complex required for the cleavage and polyadenylation of pre-mRNA 3' ends n=1 Tax=Maudiozyma barnettii TaxID=61262 RepID=A0A8H2VK11_9SACH|nr:similar to Saccharomyces cerevisiae YOL123W HRP1 Subunit of cleavage factor I, a five-subunit complex required for the cleavage and polyadenylation of pre-mRNA 3' ends [Kazachstania barnettii]CAB4256801.1 similar to Saccharomyces cerevisiae YOL123W HRP1 Subunit of cleavage factor I, a five-subunit complex required for the cleavage and polyadenylation of pre-mRNA 3' ends [Kazachstania barnettii]CAD1785454.1 similar to Saccharomyces cerevisiae YOL123W HRP1 Subunit of cleavage factor I, a five-su
MNSDEEDFNDIYGDTEKKSQETKTEKVKIDTMAQLDQLAALQALSSNLNKQKEEETNNDFNTTTAVGSSNETQSGNDNSTNNGTAAPMPWEQLQQTVSQLQPEKQTESEQSSSSELSGPVKADISKDHCKMFIGGLNWETTDEGLKAYFSKYGNVTELRIMRDSATGRSRGFAFLTFEDPKSVDEVVKSQHILDGKVIDPKRSIPREEKDKTGKIFVGGIGSDVRPKEFEEFFAQFGNIIDAQLMLDKDTGRSRGFGFITYDTPEAVDRVCSNKYLEFKGRNIEIKRAEPRHAPRGSEDSSSANVNNDTNQSSNVQPTGDNTAQMTNPMGAMNPMYNQNAMGDYFKQMQDYYQQMQQQTGMDYTQMYQQQMQQMAMMMGGFGMPGMQGMPGMPGMPEMSTQTPNTESDEQSQTSDPNVQTIGAEPVDDSSSSQSKEDGTTKESSREPEFRLPKGPRGPSNGYPPRDNERGNYRGGNRGGSDRRGDRRGGRRGGSDRRGDRRGRGGNGRRRGGGGNNGYRGNENGYHPYGRDRD